uniref:NADH-ubiquinone oxidoreductase chain 2 n=1 Tax=Candida blackwelliae TaxID=497110 RepID=S5TGJ6_9ASCO|nr:NADH dehydrogenase subunit 2 [Candida blackwelliae]AGS44552.1 NADH dehydrogenase subunit 2 [Candida blackwelliae]
MLVSSFIIFLVYTAFNKLQPHIISRLGILSILLTLIIFITSYDTLYLDNLSLFNNWFKLTYQSIPLIILSLLLTSILLIYNTIKVRYDISSPYLILIILANLTGIVLLPLVNDLIVLYIVIELQSYALYILTGLHNKSYNATRAGLLYFLTGGIASALILLASYYLYYITGSTNISDINIYISAASINTESIIYINILLLALMFKMGLAPLHQWSIAVYNYAPTYITAYISIIAKVAIIGFIFVNWSLFNCDIIWLFFYSSLIIASYKPLFNVNIKVILAYSGILNIGYLLLAISTYDISMYIYLLQYILTHICIFISILCMSEYTDKPVTKWSPIIYLNQLAVPNKTLSIILIVCLFSLIGIPPLPGFYAKYYILINAIGNNYILESIILIICSVLGTYYYASIVKGIMPALLLNNNYNIINSSLSYILSTIIILIITFYIYIPYLLEGLLIFIL